jgi:low affinity Fe/Cu permease
MWSPALGAAFLEWIALAERSDDDDAIQVKLDELIRVSRAQNIFVGVEHLTDEELEELRIQCESRAKAETAPRAGRSTTTLNGATRAGAARRAGTDDQSA